MQTSALYVRQLLLGPMKNFVYLLGPAKGNEVMVIDPAWDVDAIRQALAEDKKKLSAVLVTHSHSDHTNGLSELLQSFDVPVYAHKEEIGFSDELRKYVTVLRPVTHGHVVKVGAVEWTMLHTPGHTPGSLCIHGGGAVVTGDTLFVNACGRCDLEGGNARHLYESLYDVLGRLPDETQLLPGHDYGDVPISNMGREKQRNPYFQFRDMESFVAFRQRPRG